MRSRLGRTLLAVSAAIGFGLVAVGFWYFNQSPLPPGSPELTGYVHGRVVYPIVFTSRGSTASLRAAADHGETFVYPGQPLWQAEQGRLRMLLPSGEVSELTWEKPLPDGSTLIDVMSPSVSPDGQKIIFAGRKAAPDPGHFRLYEIQIDGTGLRQLTGGPNDPGCTAVPPMRYDETGEAVLSDTKRKRIDYDDVDPTYAPGGHIVFASSRTPDLGRDHARRSTTLWIMKEDGSDKKPLSANRNNDRWPWIASNGYVIFSLWSRNREVISRDLTTIEPYTDGADTATLPTDAWLGAHVEPNGDFFGSVLKTKEPVWRARGLDNGNYVFMTASANGEDSTSIMTVVQAKAGSISNSPSSLAKESVLPTTSDSVLVFGPSHDKNGNALQLATPGPYPDHQIILAAASAREDGTWDEASYGIYLADADWSAGSTAESISLRKVFDDPRLVDSEPVAVTPRKIKYNFQALEVGDGSQTVRFANGETFAGPTAEVHNSAVSFAGNQDAPGQKATSSDAPIFNPVPKDLIETIRVYGSYRDRFDLPDEPRTHGGFELLIETPVKNDDFRFRIPPGAPTVLAGFDSEGHVASWQSEAQNDSGERATFYAFAGDHYSGARPGFTHFCTGCHTGHSGTPTLRMSPR
ncbi:hypothetical protein Pan97_50490 [Bremerella volcania]|uniref:Translocation protein TolB n=1 Tax=Bremerella volcania TaxID=2527984 RepID=A0A518CFG2_9BACT|nr:hypothetical protein [Bremerella volcania]QDU77970.1 hypothetical protein Pan97_50490 [Bremerella volcania]